MAFFHRGGKLFGKRWGWADARTGKQAQKKKKTARRAKLRWVCLTKIENTLVPKTSTRERGGMLNCEGGKKAFGLNGESAREQFERGERQPKKWETRTNKSKKRMTYRGEGGLDILT